MYLTCFGSNGPWKRRVIITRTPTLRCSSTGELSFPGNCSTYITTCLKRIFVHLGLELLFTLQSLCTCTSASTLDAMHPIVRTFLPLIGAKSGLLRTNKVHLCWMRGEAATQAAITSIHSCVFSRLGKSIGGWRSKAP